MEANTLVSIISINYNQADVTNAMLNSLSKLTWSNFEVIIVDNNSEQIDFDKINTNYAFLKLIRNKKNLGFAGGNNTAIQTAKGKYILLLNNDTEVVPNFIEPMIELFEQNNLIGAVSPKIKFYYKPDTIQYAGYTKMNPFTLRMNALGNHQKDDGSFDKIQETNFTHGCAMMVSKEVIKYVGIMTDEYFLYYEEHDWCTAIKKAGFKIYYQPQSVVYHKESVSVIKNSPLKTYFINRNRILYMKRNFSSFFKIISTLYLIFISIPKNIIVFLIKQEYNHLNAYRDAIVWNVTHKTKIQWIL